MSVLVYGFVLITAFLAGPALTLASAPPVAGEIALVLAPPGQDIEEIVVSSGGQVIGPTSSLFGTLALAKDPAFLTELTAQGAWLVLDGTFIARLCGVSK